MHRTHTLAPHTTRNAATWYMALYTPLLLTVDSSQQLMRFLSLEKRLKSMLRLGLL